MCVQCSGNATQYIRSQCGPTTRPTTRSLSAEQHGVDDRQAGHVAVQDLAGHPAHGALEALVLPPGAAAAARQRVDHRAL